MLYTKGSVDFFSAYPGLYVPKPLGFRCDRVAETPAFLAKEILALTKMNWNNTQFDGGPANYASLCTSSRGHSQISWAE